MTPRMLSIAALVVLIGIMLLGAKLDAADEEQLHETYCHEVAVWEAEKARGIEPLNRTGHPDYRGIAEDACPGMRPTR